MGLYNRPDIFQEKMNKLLNGLDYVRTYSDDLLIISNKSLEDHIKKLDKTRERIMPLPDKVEAVKNTAVLIT